MPYPLSVDANISIQQQIVMLIEAGQGFTYSTGQNTSASAIQVGASIFNASNSGKSILIYSILVSVSGNSATLRYTRTTSDPALGTPLIIDNDQLGDGLASVGTGSFANTAVSISSTIRDAIQIAANTPFELLSGTAPILLPKGYASGIAAYVTLGGANTWSVNMRGVEL
jgi:hypothetical protein